MPFIGPLISAIASIGSQWLSNRNDIATAKHEAKIARIKQEVDWETAMAEGSLTSWKDEFWTIVIATPLILVFFPETRPWIVDGFTAIQTVMPEWYIYVLSVAVASAFGVRSIIGSIKKLKE